MRRLKYVFIVSGGLVVLCFLALAIVLLTFDDEDYRRLATRSVDYFTGYKMSIDGPFALEISATPFLSAEAIRFESEANRPPPVSSIGKFAARIDLLRLISGTLVVQELQAEDVVMAVIINDPADSENGTDDGPILSGDIDLPVFEMVRLRHIRLDVVDATAGRTIEIRLHRFDMAEVGDAGPMSVSGEGTIGGHEFDLDGRLGALSDIFKKRQPYPVKLDLKIVDFRMAVSGTIDHLLEGEGLNLQLSAEEQELSNLFDIVQLEMPDIGHLTFAATFSGDATAPAIIGLNLDIGDGTSVKLSARGSIGNLFSGAGTYISIDHACTNKDLLALMFPENWRVVEEFRFKGILGNVEGDYTLEDVEAAVLNDKDITLKAAGWLKFGGFIDGNILKAVDLNLSLASPHTDTLRPLFTDEIPEVGSVRAEGRLTGPIERLALEDLLIQRGGTGPLQMITQGRIGWIPLEDDRPIAGIDLDVSIQSTESTILSSFYGVPIGEIGNLSLTGRLTGSTERFLISDLQMRSADGHGLETMLSGEIAFAEQHTGEMLGNVNCKIRMDAPDMKAAQPLIGTTLFPDLGPVSAEMRVTGSTDVLSVEDIAVTAGRAGHVLIKWNGRIGRFPLADDQPYSDVQTVASLQAADTAALAELFGVSLPDIGPLKASWLTTDRNEIIGFRDVNIVAGDGEKLQLNAAGAIDSVFHHDKLALAGIDLQIRVRAAGTRLISKLLKKPLPDLGTVDGRLTLSGGQEALAIGDIDLMCLSPDGLKISATGDVGHIGLGKEAVLRDVGVQLAAGAPDVSAVALFSEWGLPELGSLQLNAQLNDRAGGLDVERFELRTGSDEKTTFRIEGRLNHIQSRKNEAMELLADFEALSQPWLLAYFKRSPAESPRFSGSLRLAISDGAVRIEDFKTGTAELDGLSLQASGMVSASARKPEINVKIISTAENPSAWGALLGVPLPPAGPLAVNGRYSRQADRHIFQGETNIGRSGFQTEFHGAFDRQRPGVDLVVSAETVYLEDLGLYPETRAPEAGPSPPPQKKRNGPLFDEKPLPFDMLQAFDFSLRLNADTVSGKNVSLNQVGLDMILENGRLRIGPSTVNYRQGVMSIEGDLDAHSDAIPAMDLKITAEDMDIKDVLSYLHELPILEGQLNLVMDLRSMGRSIKQIASGLTGELSLGLENGRIKRIINLLASDALDFLFTAPVKNTYTDLSCMAARMQFEDGNGTVEVLYLETPAVRARGAGSVNLAQETIDIVINPTAKRRLYKRSSPVRIRGELGNPSIKKIPATEAAALAGQILAPFVALPARALGYLWSLMRDDKDEKSPCIGNFLPDKSQAPVER